MRRKTKMLIVSIIALVAILAVALIGCGPKTLSDAITQSDKAWAEATNKTVTDKIKISNLSIVELNGVKGKSIIINNIDANISRTFTEEDIKVEAEIKNIDITVSDAFIEKFGGLIPGNLDIKDMLAKLKGIVVKLEITYANGVVSGKLNASGLKAFDETAEDTMEQIIEPIDLKKLAEENGVSEELFKSVEELFDIQLINLNNHATAKNVKYKSGKSVTGEFAYDYSAITSVIQKFIENFGDIEVYYAKGGGVTTVKGVIEAMFGKTNINEIITQYTKISNVKVEATLAKIDKNYYFDTINGKGTIEIINMDKSALDQIVKVVDRLIPNFPSIVNAALVFIKNVNGSGDISINSTYKIN